MKDQSSFTLIELLIVIGILAILVASVIVILNPAQLLAQARDSKRQQDLSALNQALQTITALDQTLSFGSSSVVYTSLPDSSSTCGSWGLPSLPSGWNYHCVSTTTLQNTDGTGWIPVNFKTTGVVSLSALPTDPQNTSSTGLYYTYVTGGSYELNGILESSKYRNNTALTKLNLPGVLSYGSNQSLSPLYNTSGLVGYWNFDNNVLDQSGNNNNGVWYGTSTTRYVGGKVGSGAGTFNGSNDYVDVGGVSTFNPGSGDVSLGFWINMADTSRIHIIFGKRLASYGYLSYVLTSGGNTLQICNGSCSSYGSVNVMAGQWQQIFIVFSRTTNKALSYMNGALGYWSDISAKTGTLDSSGSLQFGRDPSDGTNVWSGSIDDARVYNRALSASEIQALYNATK